MHAVTFTLITNNYNYFPYIHTSPMYKCAQKKKSGYDVIECKKQE